MKNFNATEFTKKEFKLHEKATEKEWQNAKKINLVSIDQLDQLNNHSLKK